MLLKGSLVEQKCGGSRSSLFLHQLLVNSGSKNYLLGSIGCSKVCICYTDKDFSRYASCLMEDLNKLLSLLHTSCEWNPIPATRELHAVGKKKKEILRRKTSRRKFICMELGSFLC